MIQFRMTNAVPTVTKAKNASTSQSRFESPFIAARLQVHGPLSARDLNWFTGNHLAAKFACLESKAIPAF
jgi:hypothetical protein